MLGFHTASLFGPTYDRVFDGVVPPRTGAVSVINRVSCMCCEPGRAARLVHLAGASRVADGLDRCPGVPGGSQMDVFIRHARLYYTCRCQGTYLALSTTPLLAPGACDVATSHGGRPACSDLVSMEGLFVPDTPPPGQPYP